LILIRLISREDGREVQIWSNIETTIGDTKIVHGKNKTNLDHKDPVIAGQLRTLRKLGFIKFQEILDGDTSGSKKDSKITVSSSEPVVIDFGGRGVQDEKKDGGTTCSQMAKRRDGDDSSGKVRRKSRIKKRTVEKTD